MLGGELSTGVCAGRGPLQLFWCSRMLFWRLIGRTLPQLCLQVIVGLSAPPFIVLPGTFRQSHALAGRDGQGRFGRAGLQELEELELVVESEGVDE